MRVPTSTYRLQVTADFDLHAAARTLSYLHDLGVDWVYLSPILAAEPGSPHGYDVVDPTRVDDFRGGPAGLAALSAEARRLDMGVLVDIVPNHVGVATPHVNAWWWDLLTHGGASSYADTFDVDWDAGEGRVLVPVVGDDDLLPDGRIDHLSVVDDELRYHDSRFPIAPGTLPDASSLGSSGQAPGGGGDANAVHSRQHYELISWRLADSRLNYRRFFSVNTLAGVRVEDPAVFAETHREVRRWFDEGLVDGLRIDHPDGLRDPASYLDELGDLTGHPYVLVEKILALRDDPSLGSSGPATGERLPGGWATAGTTGYDALGLIDRVLTDPAGQASLDALAARLHGAPLDWAELVHGTKRAVADVTLRTEVNRIVRELTTSAGFETGARAPSSTSGGPLVEEVAQPDHPLVEEVAQPDHPLVEEVAQPDHPLVEEVAQQPSRNHAALEDAVAELLTCFPVYRSYLPDGRLHLDQAFAEARRRRAELAKTFDAIEPILADPTAAPARRFQQTSGMVMAKGVEDCAFYRWSCLTSLNEVGGDPSEFSVDVAGWHAAMAERQRDWPNAMTTTSTHDTKRSEDVRARIAVLAEIPDEWATAIDRLLTLAPLPDPGFGNLLWQAVVGIWPASKERLHAYAEKAMREAGDRTTWTGPDADYERAVHAALDRAFASPDVHGVIDHVVRRVAGPGWSNALSAKLIALTMPGVPDVYQGTELWDLSLVDPDNRRSVDFDVRRAVLARVLEGARPVLTADPVERGEAKLLLTHLALTLRRAQPDRFASYAPIGVSGDAADHVLAFDRGGAIAVATRLPVGLATRDWGATTLHLPEGEWTDLLTGRAYDGDLEAADLLADYPVALLVSNPEVTP